MSDWSTFEEVKHRFGVAADAKFKVEGVPVEVGGGTGTGSSVTEDRKGTAQATALTMEVKGGNKGQASSKTKELGTKWIDSLGPYKVWETFGFEEKSLVPIIDFSPDDLRKKCVTLMQDYFVQDLDVRNTRVAGRIASANKSFLEKDLTYQDGRTTRYFTSDLAKNAMGF